jgi:hypothetical protein
MRSTLAQPATPAHGSVAQPPLAADANEPPRSAPTPRTGEGSVPKPVATDNQMLHKYVWSTIGFDGALSATLTSGIAMWKSSPPEWSLDFRGYTRRWVSEYAESAIGDGAKYAVAHFFRQDPSFYPCVCSGFARRLHHAVDSPFMARKRDGTRVLSAATLAGVLASHVVSASTWYPAPAGTRDGLRHAAWSLVSKIGVNVFKEFRPRQSKKQP